MAAEAGVNGGPDLKRLLRNSLAGLAVGAVLVAICYWFVDRPVAFFVYNHKFAEHPFLKWLTYPPPILQAWAPFVIAVLMVRRAWAPFRRCELVVLGMFVSIILADQFRQSLMYVFGRYWPETWINDNPSLIGNGEYGFHPFHSGSAYGSFPSGHTARTVAMMSVVWIACPKWRWICVVAVLAEIVGLLGMDYHFVGDIVGGGFVGGTVAAYVAVCLGLGKENASLESPAT